MKLSTFLIVSVVGRLPGTYFLTMQGATIRNQQYHIAAIAAFACGVLLIIAYFYRAKLFDWMKHRHDPQPPPDENTADS